MKIRISTKDSRTVASLKLVYLMAGGIALIPVIATIDFVLSCWDSVMRLYGTAMGVWGGRSYKDGKFRRF